jgi:hypothetical protein
MEHFPTVYGKRFLIKVQGMVNTGLDGPIHRIRPVNRPVIALARIEKFDTGNIFDTFISILGRND